MALIIIIVIVLVCLTMGCVYLTLWVGWKWAGLQKRITLAWRGSIWACLMRGCSQMFLDLPDRAPSWSDTSLEHIGSDATPPGLNFELHARDRTAKAAQLRLISVAPRYRFRRSARVYCSFAKLSRWRATKSKPGMIYEEFGDLLLCSANTIYMWAKAFCVWISLQHPLIPGKSR